MSIRLVHDNYGKSRVRLLKVERGDSEDLIQNVTLNISFEGDFEAIHRTGDNALCLPTDTMKNTVYALASQVKEIEEIETFGLRLAFHFLANNPQVSKVCLDLVQHGYDRLTTASAADPHAFVRNGLEVRTASIIATREGTTVESGVDNLVVLKTAHSGFVGYKMDEFTTLRETTDRIFSTAIKAHWRYSSPAVIEAETFDAVRNTILECFAEHDSLSVQHTLYAMGQAVLDRFAEIESISFSLPNIHFLPVDLSRFGLKNENCIFLPTDEPHGLIEATLER
jgi:urate oxidase